MRDVILKLVTVAMLFVTVEGVAKPVDEETFHQTHHAHADDGDQWFHDGDTDDHECETCEHFCHVHALALPSQALIATYLAGRSLLSPRPTYALTRVPAPPIPPPNI